MIAVVRYGISTREVADRYGVSQRRVQQLCKYYRDTGKYPEIHRSGRKRYRKYPAEIQDLILETYRQYKCCAGTIGRILRKRYKMQIDNNVIHLILKVNGMARDEPGKRKRKKPWVRYEREHSLSAVHMDWCYNKELEKWVCACMDDASRMILSMGEFEKPTTENTIKILDEACNKYAHLMPIREVIVDHGSQFYPVRKNKKGRAKHKFVEYCKGKGIKVIYCKYAHPQSNGKLEKFYHLYQRRRGEFATLEEFLHWYNCVRPHLSLDFDNLETPEKAFYRKLQDILMGNCIHMVEVVLNEAK